MADHADEVRLGCDPEHLLELGADDREDGRRREAHDFRIVRPADHRAEEDASLGGAVTKDGGVPQAAQDPESFPARDEEPEAVERVREIASGEASRHDRDRRRRNGRELAAELRIERSQELGRHPRRSGDHE